MAFADIADTTSTNLQLFAVVNVYDRDTDTTTTLYWSEGDTHTDQVDGTVRDWEGRIDGWKQADHDQKIGTSRYAHPSASIRVYLGNQVGDEADGLWDYLTDDHQWEGQPLKLYLVDMSQAGGAGAELIFHGKVGPRPADLREGEFFSLRGIGRHQGARLPNQSLSMASEWRCAFLQPLVWSTSNSQLGAGVNATATTWVTNLLGANGINPGMVVACCDAGTGDNFELAWVEEVPAANQLTVKRGYMGTTAVGHAQNDWVYALLPGPLGSAIADKAAGLVIPLIVGSGDAGKGVYPYTDYVAARGWRTLGVGHSVEVWISSGVGPKAQEYWYESSGSITVDAAPTTYNDISGAYGANAINHGDAIPALAENVHLEPNPIPSGTYVEGEGIQSHMHSQIQYWVRVRGLTRENTQAGTVITSVAEIIKYVMQTPTWGLGYTLADVVDDDRIDGWDSGDFPDEYAEAWWNEIAGAFPAFGATSSPYALDVLQEFCDLVNADMFVRGGKLYPKRRTVAATADLTVEDYHLVGSRPVHINDPHGAYCNVFRAAGTPDLMSEPDEVNNNVPITIPYESIIGDDDEIDRYGDIVETRISRLWARMELATQWDMTQVMPAGAQQTRHLEYWEAVHQEQLAMRAQPQIYIRATVQENCTWLQQGHTVEFNVPGITTAKGQVRQVERSRPASGNGPRRPIRTEIESWHISFP